MSEQKKQPDLIEELKNWKEIGKRNKYFQNLKGENKIQCLKCGKYLSGNRLSNIKRHYRLIHKKKIDIEGEKESETESETENEEDDGSESSAHSQARESAKKPKHRAKVWVNIDKSQFLECCLGLITLPNVPVEIFDNHQFFKSLIEPFERKFGTNLSSRNILPMLENSTLSIQDRITKNLKHKLLSLKVDMIGCTKRAVLGINVVYMKNFEMCTEMLGFLQIRKHQSAEHLKDEIQKCLLKYQIEPSQIYSKSIDYGANILGVNREIQEWKEAEIVRDDDAAAETDFKHFENLYHSLVSILADTESPSYILDQVAQQVLPQLESHINELRANLSQLNCSIKATDNSVKLPNLPKRSYWTYIYYTMKYLVEIKDQIDVLYSTLIEPQFELNWNFIMEFITAFFPLITCKQSMYKEQYIIGDFYRDWLTCKLELEDLEVVTPFANLLADAMRERECALLASDAFLPALFLDARFNFENCLLLTQVQKQTAISNLCKTYQRIKDIEDAEIRSENISVGSVEIKSEVIVKMEAQAEDTIMEDASEPSKSNPYSKLQAHILAMMISKSGANELQRILHHKLQLFADGNMLLLDADILKNWQTYSLDNELKKLAQIVLSVPVNRVSMKQAFTGLNLLETNLKSQFSDEKLNNILLTNLNFHLLDSSGSNPNGFDWADI